MERNPIDLWPRNEIAGADNAISAQPTITCFPPKGVSANTAIVVCPGGGYETHSAIEADPVAEWLSDCGITAFVLRYRLAPHRHPDMHSDAARAIRMIRSSAATYAIDPNRIGIIGFSAGGHLAGSAATIHDAGDPNNIDPIERVSSRPDLAILVYPVVSFLPPYTCCVAALLGKNPDPELLDYLSLQNRADKFTPPTFLVHSIDDDPVPVGNSLMMASALAHHGVPFELHVFDRGEHGYGLARHEGAPGAWTDLCIDWLKRHAFIRCSPQALAQALKRASS